MDGSAAKEVGMADEDKWWTPGVELGVSLPEVQRRHQDRPRSSARATAQAEELFREALDWLGATYGEHVFYLERDIVFTLQTWMVSQVEQAQLGLRVYNDYRMLPGPRRGLSADLAFLSEGGDVLLAAEFKYEPCHKRHDVLRNKLPVTVWAEIQKDRARVEEFVAAGATGLAYAVLIDEGGLYATRDLSVYAEHREWDGSPRHHHGVWALLHREADPLLGDHAQG